MNNICLIFLTIVLLINCSSKKEEVQSKSDLKKAFSNYILKVTNVSNNNVEVFGYTDNGSFETIYSQQDTSRIPTCSKGDFIFFNGKGISVYQISNQQFIDQVKTENYCSVDGCFKTRDWVFYSERINDSTNNIVIYDFVKKKLVKRINGYAPKISTIDDCLYYIDAELNTQDTIPIYLRKIYKYSLETNDIKLITTIQLSEYDKYDVEEVIPKTNKEFYYLVYNEHEYRYYSNFTGEEIPFFLDGNGNESDGMDKEQFNLTFSDDLNYASFTERNWNELTYLVYIDFKKNKRFDLNIFGSFPFVKNDKLFFISDPGFVNATDVSFRQIKNYALYYYDIKSGITKRVKDFKGQIAILN